MKHILSLLTLIAIAGCATGYDKALEAHNAAIAKNAAEHETREQAILSSYPVTENLKANMPAIKQALCGAGKVDLKCGEKMQLNFYQRLYKHYPLATEASLAEVNTYPEKYQTWEQEEGAFRKEHMDNERRKISEADDAHRDSLIEQKNHAEIESSRRRREAAAEFFKGMQSPKQVKCVSRDSFGQIETNCTEQ